MKGVSQRQEQILNYIKNFIHLNNYSPSYREIMKHFGFRSVGTVYKHLQVLKRKGTLSAEKQCSRSLIPTLEGKKGGGEIPLPFIGYISAGKPIEMFSKSQTIGIPEFLVHSPEKTYVLKAKGEELNEEMIADGDLLIVEARNDAQPGETIIALINQYTTIIKRYYPEGESVRLVGNTPYHQPIIIRKEDMLLQGVVVSLLRTFF